MTGDGSVLCPSTQRAGEHQEESAGLRNSMMPRYMFKILELRRAGCSICEGGIVDADGPDGMEPDSHIARPNRPPPRPARLDSGSRRCRDHHHRDARQSRTGRRAAADDEHAGSFGDPHWGVGVCLFPASIKAISPDNGLRFTCFNRFRLMRHRRLKFSAPWPLRIRRSSSLKLMAPV